MGEGGEEGRRRRKRRSLFLKKGKHRWAFVNCAIYIYFARSIFLRCLVANKSIPANYQCCGTESYQGPMFGIGYS